MEGKDKSSHRKRISAPVAAAIGAVAGALLAITSGGLTGREVIILGAGLGAVFGLAAFCYYKRMTAKQARR